MKVLRWFTIAFALLVPLTVLAERAPDDEDRDMDRDTVQRDDQDVKDRASDKDTARKVTDKETMRMKSSLVPAVAGIEAADKAVAALYELSGADQLDPIDARNTLQLARQGIQMALDRSEALHRMGGLSSDAKSEANRASTKLRDARKTLQRMEKLVGKKQSRISANQVEEIHEQARDLHTALSDAESAVERVAKAYDISTDLELEG